MVQGSFMRILGSLLGGRDRERATVRAQWHRTSFLRFLSSVDLSLNFRAVFYGATPPTEDTLCTSQVRFGIKNRSVCNDLNEG